MYDRWPRHHVHISYIIAVYAYVNLHDNYTSHRLSIVVKIIICLFYGYCSPISYTLHDDVALYYRSDCCITDENNNIRYHICTLYHHHT